MRALLVLSFLLIAPLAAAQEGDRFYPLGEGDTWTYRFYEQVCDTDGPPCFSEVERFVRRTVVGTVEAEGAERPLIRAEVRVQPSDEPTCTADYAVWVDEGTSMIRVEPVGDPCSSAYRSDDLGFGIFETLLDLDEGSEATRAVDLGPVAYSLLVRGYSLEYGFSSLFADLAEDVGLVGLSNSFNLGGSSSVTNTSYALLHAVVDGETYGSPPVAGEPGAGPASSAAACSPSTSACSRPARWCTGSACGASRPGSTSSAPRRPRASAPAAASSSSTDGAGRV